MIELSPSHPFQAGISFTLVYRSKKTRNAYAAFGARPFLTAETVGVAVLTSAGRRTHLAQKGTPV